MKRTRTLLHLAMSVLLACVALSSAVAQTPSPTLIPFQGRLTNQENVPYTGGQYTVTFNLYREAVGGTSLWTERHEKVGVFNGMVNVFLGSITQFPSQDSGAPFFATVKHLGITIDADSNTATADPEMVPRQMIIPAFYAKQAGDSTKLAGYDWTHILSGGSNDPSSATLRGDKLEPSSIGTSQLAANAVTSTQIAAGSVGEIEIAANGVGTEELVDSSVTESKIEELAVTESKIADGSITTAKIAAGAVAWGKKASRQILVSSGVGDIPSAGQGQVAVSWNSGAFETGSTALPGVDVPGLVAEIETSGNPIAIDIVPNLTAATGGTLGTDTNNGSGGWSGYLYLYKSVDGAPAQHIAGMNFRSAGSGDSASTIRFMDYGVIPGNKCKYSLKARVSTTGTSQQMEVFHMVMVLSEL